MEDTVSHSSVDSALDEFVLVNAEPRLHIAGNGGFGELERKLSELLSDDFNNPNAVLSAPPVRMSTGSNRSEKSVATCLENGTKTEDAVIADCDAKKDLEKETHLVETKNSFNNMNVDAKISDEGIQYYVYAYAICMTLCSRAIINCEIKIAVYYYY